MVPEVLMSTQTLKKTTYSGRRAPTRPTEVRRVANVVAIEIPICGRTVTLDIRMGTDSVALSDIVPVAHRLCDEITDVVLDVAACAGQTIACKKGCSTCCHRALVPLSVPEALRLRRDILAHPPRTHPNVQKRLLRAATRIMQTPPPKLPVPEASKPKVSTREELQAVSDWYEGLNLSCPFLQDDCCGIHEYRPLACRQYFIRGSSLACSGMTHMGHRVEIPVSMTDVLARLTAELTGCEHPAIALPLLLPWTQANPQLDKQVYSSQIVANKLGRIIRETAMDHVKPATQMA